MARVLTINYESGTTQSFVAGENLSDYSAIEWAIKDRLPTATINTFKGSTVVVQVSKVNSYWYGEYLDEEEAAQAHADLMSQESNS